MDKTLEAHGIFNGQRVHWNLSAANLVEHALRRGEGQIASNGALVAKTGQHTGRAPQDKYIVEEPSSQANIHWGQVNRAFDADRFDRLHARLLGYLQGRELFVRDCRAGADPRYSLPIRVINEYAWHNLFARQLFIDPADEAAPQEPKFTVLCAPGFHAEPERDGTRSKAFIIMNLAQRIVIIGGTAYAGEMKKSVFSLLN